MEKTRSCPSGHPLSYPQNSRSPTDRMSRATGNELSKKSNKITCCNTGNRDLRALHKETLRIETQESAGMRFRKGGQAIVLTKMEHSQKRRKDDTVSHLLTGSSQKNRGSTAWTQDKENSIQGLSAHPWAALSWCEQLLATTLQ
ncbi:hypothetical protein U0070_019877 [Myodes glareolus]|uniref:Uncharacterized protein n=1 Tax=Myodes glareolus TaxID=447135 RepID=A0AAW0JLT9_MYOGA